jgi:acylphosphatase
LGELELAVGGWAENLPDGRVEDVARGSEAVLGQLERALRAGPPFAVVENVEMSAIPHEDVDLNFFDTR